MQKFVLGSLVVGGLVLGAVACTDEAEKPWPKPTTSEASSSSSGSESTSSSSSSSGTAGAAGAGGSAGTGGVGTGGAGGSAGTGGIGTGGTGTGGAGTGGAGTGGVGMGGMGASGGSVSSSSSSSSSASSSASSSSSSSSGAGGAGGMGGGGNAPQDPMNLTVTIMGKDVKLDWTKSVKPTSLIVRKLGSDPTGPNDSAASIVYVGTGQSSTEALRNLLPDTVGTPRTYHYAVYGCDGTCTGTPAFASLTPTIGQCLIGGGYNFFWRHASADVCSDNTGLGTAANTSYPDWWKRCDNNCPMGQTPTATARQLNATGMMEADAIGKSLTMRGISFGRMLSSEYCRTLSTAQLMNVVPMANIEQKQEITYFVYDEANRCTNSMALLAVEPPAGGNTGMVSHAGFVCPTLDSLAWSETAIFKPDGMGGSTFITKVKWNEWAALP